MNTIYVYLVIIMMIFATVPNSDMWECDSTEEKSDYYNPDCL